MHFTPYPANHPAGPEGWPMNIHNKPVAGSIEMTDEEYEKYRAERQPMYDAWLAEREKPRRTSDEILAAKLATGFHDVTTGHYLAIEKLDMEMWGMVQSGLNTALLTGAMTAASPFPGAIWGGTKENPNARNVQITGTCGEILGLVFRAMLEFQTRHAAAKQESGA